jgi:hypothetical protein
MRIPALSLNNFFFFFCFFDGRMTRLDHCGSGLEKYEEDPDATVY